ncbi:MAG: formylmethanofuran dehydrogenase subunit E family protein [candidate division WOR-3 bacterium]
MNRRKCTAKYGWQPAGVNHQLAQRVLSCIFTNVTSATLAAAARFHGHLGPWLVLGLRAGFHSRRLGGSPFARKALVWCPARTPYSCFIDGIQFASGCTLGKANIRHIPSRRCRVRFASGRSSITLTVRTELFRWLEQWQDIPETTVERLARRIARTPFSLLFEVEHG